MESEAEGGGAHDAPSVVREWIVAWDVFLRQFK